jgi:hypothetical protein
MWVAPLRVPLSCTLDVSISLPTQACCADPHPKPANNSSIKQNKTANLFCVILQTSLASMFMYCWKSIRLLSKAGLTLDRYEPELDQPIEF